MLLLRAKQRSNFELVMGLDKLPSSTKLQGHSQLKLVKDAVYGESTETHSGKLLKRSLSNNINRTKLLWKIFDFLDICQTITKIQ